MTNSTWLMSRTYCCTNDCYSLSIYKWLIIGQTKPYIMNIYVAFFGFYRLCTTSVILHTTIVLISGLRNIQWQYYVGKK